MCRSGHFAHQGVVWSGQYERIQRDEVLSDALLGVRVTRTPEEGGSQEMVCLPIDLIPGWLFGVQPSRVKEDIRPKLIRCR